MLQNKTAGECWSVLWMEEVLRSGEVNLGLGKRDREAATA